MSSEEFNLTTGEDIGQALLCLAFFSWLVSAILQVGQIDLWLAEMSVGYTPPRYEWIFPTIFTFLTIYASTRWKSD